MLINLKKLRKERNLSQQELAEILGISQQSINKYENHDVQPDFHTLKKMAMFFNTSVDYLIGNDDYFSATFNDASLSLSAEEITLLAQFRNLDENQRNCLRMLMQTWKQ